MAEDSKPGRSKLKIVLVAAGAPALAGLIAAAVLGGYTPFYRTFLQAPAKPHYAEKIPGIEGIDYVARINGNLYRGAWPADHLLQLRKLGIESIVNFRYRDSHDYRDRAEALGIKYDRIPLHPGEPPTKDEIERFLAIVDDPANHPVYIHCTLGIDRTGVMAGIYRIERDGWSNREAVAEMEYFGHNELWIDLEDFLKTYPVDLEND